MFAPHHDGETTGIDMERRNDVTVTLCNMYAHNTDKENATSSRRHFSDNNLPELKESMGRRVHKLHI